MPFLRSRDEFLRLFPGRGENFPAAVEEKRQNSGRSRSVDEDGGDSAEEEDNDERRRERWRWRRPRRKGELSEFDEGDHKVEKFSLQIREILGS